MRTLLAAYVLFCLTLLLLMDLGQARELQRGISLALGDKLAHVVVSGTLALLLNLTLLRVTRVRRTRTLLLGAAVAAAMCTVEEATNLLTPYRGAEALDLVANYTGILLIGVAPLALLRLATAKQPAGDWS